MVHAHDAVNEAGGRAVVVGLMLIASTSPVSAQWTASSVAPSPAARGVAHVPSTCRVASFVAGGVVGALVGGTAGVLIERAFYPTNEDAGVTGLGVGIIVGAGLGIHLAPRVCGVDMTEFRRHLREEVRAPAHGPLGAALPRGTPVRYGSRAAMLPPGPSSSHRRRHPGELRR